VHPDGIDKINSAETTLLECSQFQFVAAVTGVPCRRICRPFFLVRKEQAALATPLVLFGLVIVSTLVLAAHRIPRPLISANFFHQPSPPLFLSVASSLGRVPGDRHAGFAR
jgi:hypothetical protein